MKLGQSEIIMALYNILLTHYLMLTIKDQVRYWERSPLKFNVQFPAYPCKDKLICVKKIKIKKSTIERVLNFQVVRKQQFCILF